MRVVVGMATMKGREREVAKAYESLMRNTIEPDDIILYNNAIEEVDLTDNGKFFGLSCLSEPVIYLSCDDDLIYPPNFIWEITDAVDKYNCIVTYHGRKLTGVGKNYYRGHKAYSCLSHYPQTCEIDVCGTGVTAFRTDYFNPVGIHTAEDKRMSDLVFSLEAAKQGKKIMHIGHKGGWIQQQPIERSKTIFGMESGNCIRQNEIADEIYLIKN